MNVLGEVLVGTDKNCQATSEILDWLTAAEMMSSIFCVLCMHGSAAIVCLYLHLLSVTVNIRLLFLRRVHMVPSVLGIVFCKSVISFKIGTPWCNMGKESRLMIPF